MISFDFRLRNPFVCKPFRTIGYWTRSIGSYKHFEIQLSYYAFNWFEINADLNWRQTDHAGPNFMINVFGLTLDVRVYDVRHWNDDINDWQLL